MAREAPRLLSRSMRKPMDQLHVTSSPLAALFKVLLEDQKRIVCIEFQWRLFLSVHFLNILSIKVAIFFSEIAKIDKATKYLDINCKRMS